MTIHEMIVAVLSVALVMMVVGGCLNLRIRRGSDRGGG
jgi:hypothetical protein